MRAAVVAALSVALGLPAAPAVAHVEVKPPRAPAGSESRLTFEVPNERPTAATTGIAIQLPVGVTASAAARAGGWRVRASGRRVTLTAPSGRELRAEERGRFPLRLRLPVRPRSALVFKVLQTYDSGEVVRWIGPPGTSEPAARLRLTAATQEESQPAQEREPAQAPTSTEPPAPDGGDEDGGVPIWAGIGLMVLAAVAGTAAARARNRRRMRDFSGR